MVVKYPSRTPGVNLPVGITVELMKELDRVVKTHCHHPCLIPVITRSPVAIFELLCHSDLDYLLSITENTKFSFTCQHFTPPDNT